MSSSDSRFERIEDIERKLASRPEGWTTGELAREYGVDPKCFQGDCAACRCASPSPAAAGEGVGGEGLPPQLRGGSI